MNQSQTTHLIECNLSALDGAIQLLTDLPCEIYTRVNTPAFESSLGKHCRHIIDHYLCFCRDIEHGVIDYDQRMRDCQIETDKDHAISICRDIQSKLKQLLIKGLDSSHKLKVLMCNDVRLPAGEMADTSLGRELQFLQGHSVHHFALMAAMVKLSGIQINTNFGVAPSTIVHHKTVKVSA